MFDSDSPTISHPPHVTPSHPPHVSTLHHEEQSDDYDDFDMSPMKYRNSQQNSKWTESRVSVRGREREEGGRGREREEGGRGREREEGGREREREEGGRGREREEGGRGREVGGKGKSVFDILESESLEQVKKYPTRSNSSSFYNKGFNVYTCTYIHARLCLSGLWLGGLFYLSFSL